MLSVSERHALCGNFVTTPKLAAPFPTNRFRNQQEAVAQRHAEAGIFPISEEAKVFFYVTIVNPGFLFDESER